MTSTSNYFAAFGKEPDKELKSRAKKLGNEFMPESIQDAFKRNLSDDTEYETEDELEVQNEAPDVSDEVADDVIEDVAETVDEVSESTNDETESETEEESEMFYAPTADNLAKMRDEDFLVPDKISHISKQLDELYDEESEQVSIDLNVNMKVESDAESEAKRIQEQIRQERLKKLKRSSVGEVSDAYDEMRKRMNSQQGEKE